MPHGLQLVAFVAAPGVRSNAGEEPFNAAYQYYSQHSSGDAFSELRAIKAWGADTVRMQLSEPGAAQGSTLFDAGFVDEYVAGVKAARAIGLNVIVSVQDEKQSGETGTSQDATDKMGLPGAETNAVWKYLAPLLNGDDGIMYEMYNEPQPDATSANWSIWADAMNATIATIRSSGATNALIADGLQTGERLGGVIPLTDKLGKVIYSSHPYFHTTTDQMKDIWDFKFGSTAQTLPVIVGEWSTPASGTFYCETDALADSETDTRTAGRKFLSYIADRNIGLVAANYDFGALPRFGGPTFDFDGTPTSYAGKACGDVGFGPGTLIQQWYRTGVVPSVTE